MPCILPQVVFINCKIFFASVEDEDMGVPGFAVIGFLMGDRGRAEGLVSPRLAERVGFSRGGVGMIEGNPMDDESSSSSSGIGGDPSEPNRGRFSISHGVGDFPLYRSSNVLVLGLDCDSLLESLAWLDI